jgi:hypothetical protein
MTPSTLPDYPNELTDSAEPTPDQAEFEKQRGLLWKTFCDSVRARADHAERLNG